EKSNLRRKRLEVREILRELCRWKGVEIIEGEICLNHVHLLVNIPPKNTAAIKTCIQNQLKADKEAGQLTLFDPKDPFTGGK
ncbi:MAG: transposase, partial [Clostridia bacterium]|nr:transposase [Clostridia bacterium]